MDNETKKQLIYGDPNDRIALVESLMADATYEEHKKSANLKGEYLATMHKLNDSIREFAVKEQGIIAELIDCNEKLELIEILQTDKVVNATKEDGKLKYTNDTQRKTALAEALNAHAEFQDLKNKKKEKGKEMGTLKIEKEYLERKLKIMDRIFDI